MKVAVHYYHATGFATDLQPGDQLLPLSVTGAKSQWGPEFYAAAGEQWRMERVWLSPSPQAAADWVGGWYPDGGTVVYEVLPRDPKDHQPEDPDDEDSLDYGMTLQVHATSATVLCLVPYPAAVLARASAFV